MTATSTAVATPLYPSHRSSGKDNRHKDIYNIPEVANLGFKIQPVLAQGTIFNIL